MRDVTTLVCHSYDINCQWSPRLWSRIPSYPDTLQPLIKPADLTFKIPKLHIQGHRWECHPKFSFNYSLNVGRIDGEGIERRWAATNEIASAAGEMSPGTHQEYLDNVLGYQNHTKVINLGMANVYTCLLDVRAD
jgi:hypothetical protein